MITLRSRAFFIYKALAGCLFVILFLGSANDLAAQNSKASFPGGNTARTRYIHDSLRYPFGHDNLDVRLLMKYDILPNGKIASVRVIRVHVFQLSPPYMNLDTQLYAAEAKRLILSMPKHKPAMKNNNAVKSSDTVTVYYPDSMLREDKLPLEPPAATEPQVAGAADEPFQYVEEQAQFPGGQDSMQRFIQRNMQYPAEARENNIEGRVFVRFVVGKTGEIRNIKVVKGVPQLNQEAIRLISIMPKWSPGKQNGRPVDCYYTLPINFVLQ